MADSTVLDTSVNSEASIYNKMVKDISETPNINVWMWGRNQEKLSNEGTVRICKMIEVIIRKMQMIIALANPS